MLSELNYYPLKTSLETTRATLAFDVFLAHACSPPATPLPTASEEIDNPFDALVTTATEDAPAVTHTAVFGYLPDLGKCVLVQNYAQDGSLVIPQRSLPPEPRKSYVKIPVRKKGRRKVTASPRPLLLAAHRSGPTYHHASPIPL